jgi:hypothetical protein
VTQDVCEALFKLDIRIEDEYLGFLEGRGISDEVDKLAEKLVIKYNGSLWAIKKKECMVKTYGECLKEAKKEIYGYI